MTTYNVSINKIKKLINPLEGLGEKSQLAQQINELLNKKDVFSDNPQDPLYDYKKIAYCVSNPGTQSIMIDVVDNKPSLMSGKHELAASILRGDRNIVADINGNTSEIHALFGINESALVSVPEKLELPEIFKWDAHLSIVKATLSDTDVMLKSLITNPKGTIALISEEVWNDPAFISKVADSAVLLEHIPLEKLNTQAVFDELRNSMTLFLNVWTNKFMNEYHQDEITVDNSVSKNIHDNIFSDKEQALYLLDHHKGSLNFYSYLTDEVKTDSKILAKMYAKTNDNDKRFRLENYLPASFFKNEENNDQFMRKYAHHIEKLQNYPHIYESWINDQSKIWRHLSVNKELRIERVAPLIPKELFEDENFAAALLKISTSVLNYLPVETKNHWKITEVLLNTGNYQSIDSATCFAQTNPERISLILSKHPTILNDNPPASWLQNMDYMIHAASHLSVEKTHKHIWKQLCSDPDVCSQLINQDPNLYKKMPLHIKEDASLALQYLQKANSVHNFETTDIPGILWTNQDFCINVMQEKPALAPAIPNDMWSKSTFILKVCEGFDNKKIDKAVLNHGPKEIELFFHSFKVYENYASFFQNYCLNITMNEGLKNDNPEVRRLKV